MRVYISGKITGLYNFKEVFKQAEQKLIQDGYEPINPTMVELPISCTWDDYMSVDLNLLDLADAIYMLSNSKDSKGACMEYGYALAKDKVILIA